MSTIDSSRVGVITPHCPVCSKSTVVCVDRAAYLAWRAGTLIQVAFPDMPTAQRELLITGTHGECWDILWGDDVE